MNALLLKSLKKSNWCSVSSKFRKTNKCQKWSTALDLVACKCRPVTRARIDAKAISDFIQSISHPRHSRFEWVVSVWYYVWHRLFSTDFVIFIYAPGKTFRRCDRNSHWPSFNDFALLGNMAYNEISKASSGDAWKIVIGMNWIVLTVNLARDRRQYNLPLCSSLLWTFSFRRGVESSTSFNGIGQSASSGTT